MFIMLLLVLTMAFEIELKARLDDPLPVKERISALGTYRRSYTKADSYWVPARAAPGPSTVRIRHESGEYADGSAYDSVLVTYKAKKISGSVEINDEREFTVSDMALFEDLLRYLGLCQDICKEKKGWDWTFPPEQYGEPITAELSLLTGLGWFLELEMVTNTNDPQTIAKNQKRLFALLARLEVPVEYIEPRPYTAMLRQQPGGKHP